MAMAIMELKCVNVLVVLVVVLAVGAEAVVVCNMSQEDLETCKPAVTSPDPADPTPECCKALVGADLQCLCSYRNSFMLPSLGIDPALAMALPNKCGLTMPHDCA